MPGSKHALIVGNHRFMKHSGFPNLQYPRKDVDKLQDSLDSTFDKITTLTDTSRLEVIRNLQKIANKLEPDDLFLFYYSGHAKITKERKLYLATAETVDNDLTQSALSFNTLQAIFKNRTQQKIFVVLDCCFRQNLENSDEYELRDSLIKIFSDAPGCLLSNSADDEDSKESNTLEQSIFTYHFIEGIVSKKACVYNKDTITAKSLYEYISSAMKFGLHDQSPILQGQMNVDTPLLKQVSTQHSSKTPISSSHSKKSSLLEDRPSSSNTASSSHVRGNRYPKSDSNLIQKSTMAIGLMALSLSLWAFTEWQQYAMLAQQQTLTVKPSLTNQEIIANNTVVQTTNKTVSDVTTNTITTTTPNNHNHSIDANTDISFDSASQSSASNNPISSVRLPSSQDEALVKALKSQTGEVSPCRYLWIEELPLDAQVSFSDFPERPFIQGMCIKEDQLNIVIQGNSFEALEMPITLSETNTRISPDLKSTLCYQLWINELPKNSRVILPKIKEKYSPGVCLPPQNLLVKIKSPGFQTLNQEIDLTKHDQRVAPQLIPAEVCYALNLQGLPQNAIVSLPEQETSYKEGLCLSSKNVLVDIQASGYQPYRQRHTLTDEATPINISLKPKKVIPVSSMVYLQPDEFLMGCQNKDLGCEKDEAPLHKVKLAGFHIGVTEVTFAEYDYYCEQVADCIKPNDEGWGRGNNPVINVSWNDAQKYIQWLNEHTGEQYRLPTEAEWEYSARSFSKTKYSWGDEHSSKHANSGWPDAYTKLAPVSSLTPNKFGLYDMHGNVWEWCQDWYDKGYYAKSNKINPRGPQNGNKRVLRGGSWRSWPKDLRSASRYAESPNKRTPRNGFRLARSTRSSASPQDNQLSANSASVAKNPW